MKLNYNKIYQGNCVEVLKSFSDESVDLVFADPPYNLQLKNNLSRPNNTLVNGVFDEWDKFSSFKEYDDFSEAWIYECKRVLKPNGSIWIIGSYHNIFRIGKIIQDLGLWILNDIIWRKSNPMPNFRGMRYTNAHETLIWASKTQKSKYTFNYKAMKSINGDLQMRSDWLLPICNGKERIKKDDKKVHSTQKPESLLSRVILSNSNVNDVVLDPFFGSGTTGAVAKKLRRRWIGIEQYEGYIFEANKRIDNTSILNKDDLEILKSNREEPRIPFGQLIERGLVSPGEVLFDGRKRWYAKVRADGSIISNDSKGSIHFVGANVQGLSACNGWTFWHVKRKGSFISINNLRDELRKELA